jgi:protein prenyltransferase alpha subunit repeat containing protein 1
MSRVIEPQVLSSLASDGQQQAFDAISSALLKHSEGLLEVEVLPKSHNLPAGQYVQQEGPVVAISKPGLVAAFFLARRQLLAYPQALRGNDSASKDGVKATEYEISAATAVLLLLDPEHLTAANTRKRLTRAVLHDSVALDLRLKQDTHLMLSFLSSRLFRHNKSPTLWGHLRWTTEVSIDAGLDVDEAFQAHFDAILTAAERHPRNYYAWCYARWLAERIQNRTVLTLAIKVRNWCTQHHNDTSGWSFLHFLLESMDVLKTGFPKDCFDEILELTMSLRWANEAVWVFLRTLATSNLAGDGAIQRLQNSLQVILRPSDADSVALVRRTQSWLDRTQTRTF